MLVNQADWPMRRLVGLLVATGAVTVTAGILIGRYMIPSSDSTGIQGQPLPRVDTRPTSAVSNAVPPTVVPRTTPTGSETTAPPTQAARQIPGMPTRINEFGIPVGYPHTEAGAISACGNYISTIQEPRNRDKSRIDPIFRSIALPASVEPLTKKILDADSQTIRKFSIPSINDPKFGFTLRAVGYKTLSNKSDEVIVSVWSTSSVGLYGDSSSTLAPQEKWGTDICKVSWQDGDWKLADADDGADTPAITSREAEAIQRFIFAGRPTT